MAASEQVPLDRALVDLETDHHAKTRVREMILPHFHSKNLGKGDFSTAGQRSEVGRNAKDCREKLRGESESALVLNGVAVAVRLVEEEPLRCRYRARVSKRLKDYVALSGPEAVPAKCR